MNYFYLIFAAALVSVDTFFAAIALSQKHKRIYTFSIIPITSFLLCLIFAAIGVSLPPKSADLICGIVLILIALKNILFAFKESSDDCSVKNGNLIEFITLAILLSVDNAATALTFATDFNVWLVAGAFALMTLGALLLGFVLSNYLSATRLSDAQISGKNNNSRNIKKRIADFLPAAILLLLGLYRLFCYFF